MAATPRRAGDAYTTCADEVRARRRPVTTPERHEPSRTTSRPNPKASAKARAEDEALDHLEPVVFISRARGLHDDRSTRPHG